MDMAIMMMEPALPSADSAMRSHPHDGRNRLFGQALAQQQQQPDARMARHDRFRQPPMTDAAIQLPGDPDLQIERLELPVELPLPDVAPAERLDSVGARIEEPRQPQADPMPFPELDHAHTRQQPLEPEPPAPELQSKVPEPLDCDSVPRSAKEEQPEPLAHSYPADFQAHQPRTPEPGPSAPGSAVHSAAAITAQAAPQAPADGAAAAQPAAQAPVAAAQAATVRADKPSETQIDPRFGDLLKPRTAQTAPPQGTVMETAPAQVKNPQPTAQATGLPEQPVVSPAEKTEEPRQPQLHGGVAARQIPETPGQQNNHPHPLQPPLTAGSPVPSAPAQIAGQLAGQPQVSDSQIFDQVVTHLSGSAKGETGRMVLRLHPAELGALRIELMVEGDRVRANLHAQTQQVQEVLERNLGQLRHALAEQGLKIDQFQISSDSRQNQGHGQSDAPTQHQRSPDRPAESAPSYRQRDAAPEDQAIPLAHLLQNGSGGISLHV